MKKKIKVLHVIASLGNGGAERQLIELLKYNKNHSVLLLADADMYKDTLDELGIKYWEMKVQNKFLVFSKIFFFRKIIKEYQPDIIQSWMYNACLFSTICKLIKLFNKPLIWNIRCSEMVTKYYSISLKFIIYACLAFSKNSERIVYNSFSGKAYHRKIGFSKKKEEVVYNGINSKKFNFVYKYRKSLREKYNIGKEEIVLICVARVDPMKNYDNFLKAYENIERFHKKKSKLILIGKGTDQLVLPNNCIALGMKKNIESYYSMADIIIVPSAFGEGFSNVLAEGMLTNLIPVATDIGDAKNIIGKTGFIIKGYNVESLENNLLKIINLKKDVIKIMGKKARFRANKLFTVENMVKSYDIIYSKVKL